MTDREALLRAVIADPDDDTPRLVYADCIQETGKPEDVARARFIRLQIEMTRESPKRSWFARAEQISEAAALAGRFAKPWVAELPAWAANELRDAGLGADSFVRGFVETLRGGAAKFVAHGESLFDHAPLVTADLLANRQQLLTDLFTSPLLLRLRRLFVRAERYGNPAGDALAASRVTDNLEELHLTGHFDQFLFPQRFARSKHLKKLRVLGLDHAILSAADLEVLTTSANLPALEQIRLPSGYFGDIRAEDVRRRFGTKVVF